jgi:LysM repeat protein
MNKSNPFVPKGSLLEQQSQRRSHLKIAVSCVLAVSILGLVGMLIQGCKREQPNTDLNPPLFTETNPPDMMGTNPPPLDATNPPIVLPPVLPTNPPVVVPPVVEAPAGSEYVVVKGDSLAKIAKKNGVTLKALEAANPGVIPTKLKIGQKLVIPAGGKTSADAAAPLSAATGDAGTATYTVKSGDTLTKIAKAHGTTVKAIQAANNLTTTKISVGKKLKIPSKASAAPVAPVAPTPVEAAPAPPALPLTTVPAMPEPVK